MKLVFFSSSEPNSLLSSVISELKIPLWQLLGIIVISVSGTVGICLTCCLCRRRICACCYRQDTAQYDAEYSLFEKVVFDLISTFRLKNIPKIPELAKFWRSRIFERAVRTP